MNEIIKQHIENIIYKIKDESWTYRHLESLNLDDYSSNFEKLETIEDFNDFVLETIIREQSEIIHYANAMEFLTKNDTGLQEACGLADDMGYELKKINSELLASILNENLMRESFNDLINDIE